MRILLLGGRITQGLVWIHLIRISLRFERERERGRQAGSVDFISLSPVFNL